MGNCTALDQQFHEIVNDFKTCANEKENLDPENFKRPVAYPTLKENIAHDENKVFEMSSKEIKSIQASAFKNEDKLNTNRRQETLEFKILSMRNSMTS